MSIITRLRIVRVLLRTPPLADAVDDDDDAEVVDEGIEGWDILEADGVCSENGPSTPEVEAVVDCGSANKDEADEEDTADEATGVCIDNKGC